MADAIAWARCVEMHTSSPMACAEAHCQQQNVALYAIEVRKALGGANGPDGGRPRPLPWGVDRRRSSEVFVTLMRE